MDLLVPGFVFLVLFAGAALMIGRRAGDGDRERDLLRRMTPALGIEDSDDISLTRKTKPEEGSLLVALYQTNLSQRLEEAMWQGGIYMRVSEMWLMVLLLFLAGEAMGQMFLSSRLMSFAMAGGLGILPLLYIRFRKRHRLKAFNQQLPFALDMLKSSLEAGHSLVRGLQVVVDEFADPLGTEFRTVLEQSRIGLPLPRAMEEMTKRVPEQDLRLLVTAVKVQSEVGSSLAAIIGRLSEIVRTRQRLRLQIRALTAQGRWGGMIVALLPIFVLFAFSLVQPDYVNTLFRDPTGLKILKAAIVMDVLALVTIRKLVKVDF
jgi:tight adherence protein B